MDGTTEAAFIVYFNRVLIMRYLQTALYSASNLLRDNLWCTLSCSEVIATLRGRAAYHDKVVTRLRFFSASRKLDGWSALNMAPVLELLRAGLVAIIADHSTMPP